MEGQYYEYQKSSIRICGSEYAGNWGAGAYIPQDELEAGEPEKAARIIGNGNVISYCFGEYEMSAEKESSALAAKRK